MPCSQFIKMIKKKYLSSTVAMLPIPPSRAPLLSLLEMYVLSSGSASEGRLLSISVRLQTGETVRAETRQELRSHSATDGEWMKKADETQPQPTPQAH